MSFCFANWFDLRLVIIPSSLICKVSPCSSVVNMDAYLFSSIANMNVLFGLVRLQLRSNESKRLRRTSMRKNETCDFAGSLFGLMCFGPG
jgi:nitrate reductase gamma subunit